MTTLLSENGPACGLLAEDEFEEIWCYADTPDEGARRAFQAIVNGRAEARAHYYFPITRETVPERFNALARKWRSETRFLSSVEDIAVHPAYQQIIGMGPAVIPFILADLERQADHWFWALKALTGVDPVPAAHRGNLLEMTRAWLRWGREQGYSC